MKVEVNIVSAFLDSPAGGNKAGVVLNSDKLTAEQKLSIASQVGLSETAFVSSSSVADIKLEFFTPTRQIAHCGHATIATFSYLNKLGLIKSTESSKETIDGIRSIRLKENYAYMQQNAPIYLDINEKIDIIALALGLDKKQLTFQPYIVNTGNSFIVVGVKDKNELSQIVPNQSLILEISELHDLIGFYVFTLDSYTENADASARMFAPRYGITEESATGMAAGPLACYMNEILNMKKVLFEIEQGYAMSSFLPSRILVELELEHSKIKSVYAGGRGVLLEKMTLSI